VVLRVEDKLRKNIEEYISSHNVCTIAISDGSNPSAHTVYYISHGLHIYFESNPQSQKLHILKSNPKISLTIDEDYENWHEIKGVQLFGRANITDEKHAPKLQKMFVEKFPHLNDYGGIPSHHLFVEVIPEKVYFMDFTKKFGHKDMAYVDEKKSILDW